MKVLSIGEILWDVFPDGEFLGGAPLNVCSNLQKCGDTAVLLSAVGDDERGELALKAMKSQGLTTEFLQVVSERATGTAVVGSDPAGESVFQIVRPAAFDAISVPPEALSRLQHFASDWLYMGTLLQVEPKMESLVQSLRSQLHGVRCFYDMNLRTGHWNFELVERLCKAASVLKLNEKEAELLASLAGMSKDGFSLEAFCLEWSERFELEVICVTLGPAGCLLYADGKAERYGGASIQVSDTVGAGDAFAAAFLHGYHRRWPMARCAAFANALGALVASRPGATPVWHIEECEAIAASLEAKASGAIAP